MKKLIFLLLILSTFLFAQTEIKSDTTDTEKSTKTNDDFKVEKDNDGWMDTWKEIEPSIRDFLSDDDDEEIEWNEDDDVIIKKSKKKKGYFRAGAGGWDLFYMPIELTEINKQLAKIGVDEFDSELYAHGGGGWGFIGSKWRIGGMGATGKMTTTGAEVNGISNKVDFEMHFGGFLMERVWHPVNKTEVYFSAVLGRSSIKMDMYKMKDVGNWDDSWTSYNKTDISDEFVSYKTTYKNSYFSAMPAIGFRYNIFRVFGVGAKVGYYYGQTNDNNWEINNDSISGVPGMDLSNIFYSVNFYFGA
eukprot:Anaeramoba_ignava/a609765_86.p3 GENE.a609765_86~~a609765_86.p3  ORF type:complete len:303 (-),score=46.34 a609765_86:1146-2054(-)